MPHHSMAQPAQHSSAPHLMGTPTSAGSSSSRRGCCSTVVRKNFESRSGSYVAVISFGSEGIWGGRYSVWHRRRPAAHSTAKPSVFESQVAAQVCEAQHAVACVPSSAAAACPSHHPLVMLRREAASHSQLQGCD